MDQILNVNILRSRLRTMSIVVTAVLFAVPSALASDLPVSNPSFEEPAIQENQATDWTSNGGNPSGGVNEYTLGFSSAADGGWFHYLNLPVFGGPNPSVTESNPTLIGIAGVGTYTLTVAGGRRNNDATTDGSYVVELLAGGSVIGSQTIDDPLNTYASDSWNDITAFAVVNPGDAAVGEDLTIRLSAFAGPTNQTQGQFDHVRLKFTSYPPEQVFDYDDGTLQGFVHILSDPGVMEYVSTDEPPFIPTDSGAFRVLPNPFDNRDLSHSTLLVRSPQFSLRDGAPLSVAMLGGQGEGMDPGTLPGSPSELAPNTQDAGVHALGIGLFDPVSNAYLVTAQRNESSETFSPVVITEEQLEPYIGMLLHLDVFDSYQGGWGWIGIDTVQIPGDFSIVFADGFEGGDTSRWSEPLQ